MFKKLKEIFKKTKKAYTEKSDCKLNISVKNIKLMLGKSSDVIFREIYLGGDQGLPVSIVFVDGLTDNKSISEYVIQPLMQDALLCQGKNEKKVIDLIEHGFGYFPNQQTRTDINEALMH